MRTGSLNKLNNNFLNENNFLFSSADHDQKGHQAERQALLLAVSSAPDRLQTFPFGIFFGEKGLVFQHPYKSSGTERALNPTQAPKGDFITAYPGTVLNTARQNS